MAKECSIGAEIDFVGKYSAPTMFASSLQNSPEVNHVLLLEFGIRDDVEMYSRLPRYGRCQGSIKQRVQIYQLLRKEFQ